MTAEIPQSNALAEAAPDSLSELFSTDPEKLTDAQLDRAIEALRGQRAKWVAAEQTKPVRASGPKPSLSTVVSAEAAKDIGI